MVYSGHICVYGIHFPDYKTLRLFLELFLNVRQDVKMLILFANRFEESNVWSMLPKDMIKLIFSKVHPELPNYDFSESAWTFEIVEMCDRLLRDYGYPSLTVNKKRCCYDDGSFYLGFYLGDHSVVYRESVEEYENFDTYYDSMIKQLAEIKSTYKNVDRTIVDSIMRFKQKLEEVECVCENEDYEVCLSCELYGDLAYSLEFNTYTYANDCESCS